ncbi:hypothetical protein Ndes2526A_g06575 [Nannochloris sp. 'desiccata']
MGEKKQLISLLLLKVSVSKLSVSKSSVSKLSSCNNVRIIALEMQLAASNKLPTELRKHATTYNRHSALSPIGLTPPTHLFKTMADVEKDTYSVSMLMQLKSMTPSLARRIKDADVDRDGQLSVEEIVKAIESEQTAAEDAHMMKWMVVGTLALLVILLGTLAGAIYGLVELNKDISASNNILTSSSTGQVLTAGVATERSPLQALYLSDNPMPAINFQKMILSDAYGGSATYSVASVQVKPNTSATILTTTGEEFIVDAEGIRTSGDDTSGGRRLLFWNIVGDFVGGIVGDVGTVIGGTSKFFENTWKDVENAANSIAKEIEGVLSGSSEGKEILNFVNNNANSIRTCASNPVNNYATCIAFVPCGTILNNVYKNCKGDEKCVKSASDFSTSAFQSISGEFDKCFGGDFNVCKDLFSCINAGVKLR